MKVRYTMQAYKTGQGVWQASTTSKGKRITFYLGKNIDHREAYRQAKILTRLLDVSPKLWKSEFCNDYNSLPDRVRGSLQRHFEFFVAADTDLERLFEHVALIKERFKELTQYGYKYWSQKLSSFFGERSVASIVYVDAEQFHKWCKESGLSESTISRGIRTCKSIFKYAVETGFTLQNPFCGISRGCEVNLDRMYYVDRGKFERVLSFCRDDRERLLLALGRYGGLRIPSEIRNLRYRDITDTVIRIHRDTKTGAREIPLIAGVRNLLGGLCGDPDDLIFRESAKNWHRGVLNRAILAAGMKPWPKLFVNLRSSCITDFVTIGYTDKALDSMFGNTAKVREVHYVQFRKEAEYRRMLEDDRRLSDYLKCRLEDGMERPVEPWDLREYVLAQRVANRANLW